MEVIGDYEINTKDKLGKGSFGEVVRGKHIPTNTPVAAKRIVVYDEEDRNKVKMEVAALQKAKGHPNVLQLLHHAIIDGEFWIITEYCDGSDLSNFAERIHPGLDQKLDIMAQLALALSHMNNLKPEAIIHRDVKPGNILVKAEGEKHVIKLADFGANVVSHGQPIRDYIYLTSQSLG